MEEVKTKILSDKELEYLQKSLKAFIGEICERFSITEEDAVYKIKREIDLINVRGD